MPQLNLASFVVGFLVSEALDLVVAGALLACSRRARHALRGLVNQVASAIT